jgi:protein-L-isoaspartate O-methyltransferase
MPTEIEELRAEVHGLRRMVTGLNKVTLGFAETILHHGAGIGAHGAILAAILARTDITEAEIRAMIASVAENFTGDEREIMDQVIDRLFMRASPPGRAN